MAGSTHYIFNAVCTVFKRKHSHVQVLHTGVCVCPFATGVCVPLLQVCVCPFATGVCVPLLQVCVCPFATGVCVCVSLCYRCVCVPLLQVCVCVCVPLLQAF